MIRLIRLDLPQEAQNWLVKQQRSIYQAGNYQNQIPKATKAYKTHSQDNIFKNTIRETLAAMCSGENDVRLCMYCENDRPSDVEHFRPKHFYPSQTFVWENYLYICSYCNSRQKKDHFAIFVNGHVQLLDRYKTFLQLEPSEEIAVINPIDEDPMLSIELDLPTGYFLGLDEKAETTINDILDLNNSALTTRRKDMVNAYRRWLKEYLEIKAAIQTAHENDIPLLEKELEGILKERLRKNHPTVWREMIRQRHAPRYPELAHLFAQAPELIPEQYG